MEAATFSVCASPFVKACWLLPISLSVCTISHRDCECLCVCSWRRGHRWGLALRRPIALSHLQAEHKLLLQFEPNKPIRKHNPLLPSSLNQTPTIVLKASTKLIFLQKMIVIVEKCHDSQLTDFYWCLLLQLVCFRCFNRLKKNI